MNKEFTQCLAEVYHGELVGEVAFDNMMPTAKSEHETYVLGSLLQYETEAKALMRPVLLRCGLSIHDHADAYTAGREAGAGLNGLPWLERFGALREIVVGQFLPRYEELATLITEAEDAEAAKVARFMADHERRLVKLTDNILAGVENPAAPIVELLRNPLPNPVQG